MNEIVTPDILAYCRLYNRCRSPRSGITQVPFGHARFCALFADTLTGVKSNYYPVCDCTTLTEFTWLWGTLCRDLGGV